MRGSARVAVAGLLLASGVSLTASAQGTAYEQLQTFTGVLSHVRMNYVDTVDFGTLVQSSIRGMLSSLDPHSRYVTRREFELQLQWDRGELGGPGLSLDEAGSRITVLSVTPGGPAARSGVQPGDRLIRVNDTSVVGRSTGLIEAGLVGDVGTKLRLTFERGGGLVSDTLTVTVSRSKIEHRVVSGTRMVDTRTGYVRLAEFTPTAPKELVSAVKKLRGMGAKQLVLDLRANPGGDIEAMAAIASAFLPKGTEIFHTQGRKTGGLPPVTTKDKGDFAELPLILLIDAESASAAEMLAGSLQDHDRALILGRRSFGKALMQTSLPLPNGDVVWLTTARVVTPSGRIIQRRYSGQGIDQYVAGAGKGGSAQDTMTSYRTDRGRQVRGGGGILPDVVRALSAELPAWFSVAMDSGYDSVANSVARTLGSEPSAKAAWMTDSAAWEARLVAPFLVRVRSGLGVQTTPEPPLRARIGRILAARTAALRWGEDAGEDLALTYDPDIRAALNEFPRLPTVLRVDPNTH
jgi:carboxyl-terminal processing protease